MKFLFAIILIVASSDAFLLHGRSGSIQFSGNFQSHPLFANHPYLSANKPTTEVPVPVTVDNTITESPVISHDTPTGGNGNIHGSFHSNIDIGRVVNDLVGVNVLLLKHFQNGISDHFDRKIERLEKLEKHVDNHFKKNSAGGVNVNTNKYDGGSLIFDGHLNINHGPKASPVPAPVAVPVPVPVREVSSSSDSVSGSFGDLDPPNSSDFDVSDPNLDSFKSLSTSGSDTPTVSNCEQH